MTTQTMNQPDVRVCSLQGSPAGQLLAPAALEALQQAVAAGGTAVLWMVKAGLGYHVRCRDCGTVAMCPRCDIALTPHAARATAGAHYLQCRSCGYTAPGREQCPTCHGTQLSIIGTGQQALGPAVQALVPNAEIIEVTQESIATRRAMELLGRQLWPADTAAGGSLGGRVVIGGSSLLRLPPPAGTSVVIVPAADQLLFLPDFRAHERAYQVLAQLQAWAPVWLQTYQPDHPLFAALSSRRGGDWYRGMLRERAEYSYPPVVPAVALGMQGRNATAVAAQAARLAGQLQQLAAQRGDTSTLITHGPGVHPRRGDVYYQQVLLRGPAALALLQAISIPAGVAVDTAPLQV